MITNFQGSFRLAGAFITFVAIGCVDDGGAPLHSIFEQLDLNMEAFDLRTVVLRDERYGPLGTHGTEVYAISGRDDELEDLYLKMEESPSKRAELPSLPFPSSVVDVDEIDLCCFVGNVDCGCFLIADTKTGNVIVGRWWD